MTDIAPQTLEAAQVLTEVAIKNHASVTQMIAVGDIDTTGRLRPIDSDAVEAIAASVAKDGLINPIDICQLPNQSSGRPYRLVAGGHRLAAFARLGLTEIPAFVRSNDALGRKSREIAENFFKAELSPLDRAAFVAELIETEKARMGIAPEQDGRAHNKRQTQKELKEQLDNDLCIVHKSLGIQELVAQKLGLDRSTVSRQLMLYRLPASVVERVRGMALGQNAAALRALAKMEPARQNRVVELIGSGRAATVTAAEAILDRKVPETRETRMINNVLGTFSRLGPRQKAEVLRLMEPLLPKGWQITQTKGDAA